MKPAIYFGLSLIIISIIFPTVFAFGEGDRLTQAQVDSINPDTVDLQCSSAGIQWDLNARTVFVDVACLSLEKSQPDPRPYLIIKPKFRVFIETFKQMRNDIDFYGGLFPAYGQWHSTALTEFYLRKSIIRKTIADFQTQQITDLITGWNLDQNDLNGG